MANRFWVGGTGTWDASDTTHWASSSGGAGGQSVPGSGDTVTFNGSSGGGTVTVNTTVNVQSITSGAFTGTLDFSANDNNVTITAATGWAGNGTGTRTVNMGDGTWTLTAPATWNMLTVTGLTFNANASSLILSGASATGRSFFGGGLTYNNVTFGGNTGGATLALTGANTFSALTITGPLYVIMPTGTTAVTNTFTWTGTRTGAIGLVSSSDTTQATVSCASGTCRVSWAALGRIVFSGGATFLAAQTFDLGLNSGITMTPPFGPRSSFQLGM